MSAPRDLWKKGSWRWDLWVAIVTVATGLGLAVLMEQLPQEEILKRAVMRSVAPALTPAYSGKDSDKITVLTIDDLDLKSFGTDWPLDYVFLRRQVQAVLNLKPRVLFIDFLLKRQATDSDIDALVKVICEQRGDTKVYLAAIRDDALPDSDIESRLFGEHPRYPHAKPCAKRANVQIAWDKYDQSQWSYPANLPKKDKLAVEERSAALEIFCDERKDQCPASATERIALIWPTRSFPKNLETMIRVKASTKPAEETYEPACRDGSPPWDAVPGVKLIQKILHDKAKRDQAKEERAQGKTKANGHETKADEEVQAEEEEDLRPCPSLRVFPLRAIKKQGFSDAELHEAFANKIVFLGGNIVGAADRIVSPVNGVLPGVHAHAMALDNLMTFDGKYKQFSGFSIAKRWSSPGNLFVLISVVSIVTILLTWKHFFTEVRAQAGGPLTAGRRRLARMGMAALALPMMILGAPRGGASNNWRVHFLVKLGFLVLNIVVIALIFVLGYQVLHQGPLSMLEYVLFPFLAHFLHLGETIAERSRDWWESWLTDNPWAEWARRRDASRSEDQDSAAANQPSHPTDRNPSTSAIVEG